LEKGAAQYFSMGPQEFSKALDKISDPQQQGSSPAPES